MASCTCRIYQSPESCAYRLVDWMAYSCRSPVVMINHGVKRERRLGGQKDNAKTQNTTSSSMMADQPLSQPQLWRGRRSLNPDKFLNLPHWTQGQAAFDGTNWLKLPRRAQAGHRYDVEHNLQHCAIVGASVLLQQFALTSLKIKVIGTTLEYPVLRRRCQNIKLSHTQRFYRYIAHFNLGPGFRNPIVLTVIAHHSLTRRSPTSVMSTPVKSK